MARASRRPGVRRRQPRPRLLPQGRPAHRDRRQPDGRQAAPARSSRRCSGRTPTSRSTARWCGSGSRRWPRRSSGDRRRAHARGDRPRLPRDRGRQHGERDQEDLDPARPRDLGLRAVLLRRRRRPARLLGRRHAGPQARAACIPWRACSRPTAWGSRTCARCASARSRPSSTTPLMPRLARHHRGARRGRPRRARAAEPAGRAHRYRGAHPPALQRHRHLARDPGRRARRDGAALRGRAPLALRLRRRRPRARGRAGHGRGDRPDGRDPGARAAAGRARGERAPDPGRRGPDGDRARAPISRPRRFATP